MGAGLCPPPPFRQGVRDWNFAEAEAGWAASVPARFSRERVRHCLVPIVYLGVLFTLGESLSCPEIFFWRGGSVVTETEVIWFFHQFKHIKLFADESIALLKGLSCP
eukprot:gene3134-biopygen1405